MSSGTSSEVKLEIGHVLFIDIVGYSQLLITQQSEQIETLRRIVRGTAQFRAAEAEGKLLRLPTGDGGALVFRTTPEAPVLCALEIAKELKNHPELRVRMGIHSGPVNAITDLNEQANIAGAGINTAQRVMDCGDAGHILLSKHVAEDLEHYPRWQPCLHDLGECEVKHGRRVSVVNFYTDKVGNPALPEKFRTGRAPVVDARPTRAKRVITVAIGIGALAAVAILASLIVPGMWRSLENAKREPVETSPPEKSVAVLPLVNTSGDSSNEYFSDGLSEELIAVLAKIPELKVIGRSSSFFFKGKSGDSAAIGQKLGVANLIEGSVRKQGDRVRIVAELISAADGRSLWSETYDRELKDVFAVQAEIAKSVAEQMKVKLLGEQPHSDAAPSNQNLAAHNAVLQSDFYFQQLTPEGVRRAIQFLSEAVQLDPNYALAYAKLSQAWRQYAVSFSTEATDDSAKAYGEARRAAEKAVTLAPDLVETRMALGLQAMNPDLDFRTAEKEFRRALQAAPSDAGAKSALCLSLMAEGRLSEAEEACREALSLDPLLTASWYNIGRVVAGMGRYKDAEELFRKGLEIQPHAARFHSYLVMLDILQNRPAQATANAQLESEGFWREYAVNLAQQAQSDRSTADAALKDFVARYYYIGPFQIAVLYAIRKEPDEMFKWLETAYATRDSGLTQLAVTPFFLPYRDDPRFKALCEKLGVQLP